MARSDSLRAAWPIATLQWELPSACVRAWSEELRGRGSEPPQADLRRLALAADKEVVPQDTTDR